MEESDRLRSTVRKVTEKMARILLDLLKVRKIRITASGGGGRCRSDTRDERTAYPDLYH